jgi:hypothetical protein
MLSAKTVAQNPEGSVIWALLSGHAVAAVAAELVAMPAESVRLAEAPLSDLPHAANAVAATSATRAR